jgi:5-methylcytosine-specific restriction endonuclease McrA
MEQKKPFCRKEYAKKRYQEKKEYYKAIRKKNDDPLKNKEYWENFKKSDKYMIASKKWNRENRERINAKTKENKKNNPNLRLKDSVSSMINKKLKQNKTQSTIKYLGCSIKEYRTYLESQFTADMNWENYGIYWEIDHIKPLSKGGSFHYTNTQPLTISENRSKSNSYEELSTFR